MATQKRCVLVMASRCYAQKHAMSLSFSLVVDQGRRKRAQQLCGVVRLTMNELSMVTREKSHFFQSNGTIVSSRFLKH